MLLHHSYDLYHFASMPVFNYVHRGIFMHIEGCGVGNSWCVVLVVVCREWCYIVGGYNLVASLSEPHTHNVDVSEPHILS